MTDINGAVDVRTDSSALTLRNLRGDLHARSGSGAISATVDAISAVDVETGSSAVTIAGAGATLRVSTGSGRITVAGRPRRDWSLTSDSGQVALTLDPQTSARVEFSVRSGSIGVPASLTPVSRTKQHLNTTLGAGEAQLTVASGSGGIRLRLADE